MDMFPQTGKSLKTGLICSLKRTKAEKQGQYILPDGQNGKMRPNNPRYQLIPCGGMLSLNESEQ